jgi:hypothetical protein
MQYVMTFSGHFVYFCTYLTLNNDMACISHTNRDFKAIEGRYVRITDKKYIINTLLSYKCGYIIEI